MLQAVATLMQSNDPHIIAAMDGREAPANGTPPPTKSSNQEPAAFFFVLFGLVYEALSTSSSDSYGSTSQRQSIFVAALQALKCLVKPEYAGRAISEPTIFEEFISLAYRIAMTEPAAIQVHLIEMLSTFAASQSNLM